MRKKLSVLSACSLFVAVVLIASAAHAQPGRGGPGGFGFGGPGGGGDLTLLTNASIQKELDMSEDQIEDVTKINEKQGELMRDIYGGLRDIPQEERQAKFAEAQEKMQAKMKDINAEVEDLLLKPQKKRLDQIKAQMSMRGRGGRGGNSLTGILSPTIVEQLEITESQQEKIRTKAEEIQEELDKKIAKLRAEAQEELLDELDGNQKKQFEELIGDPFDFSALQQGFGGFGGGQPGTGGQRGGGQRGGGQRGGGRPNPDNTQF